MIRPPANGIKVVNHITIEVKINTPKVTIIFSFFSFLQINLLIPIVNTGKPIPNNNINKLIPSNATSAVSPITRSIIAPTIIAIVAKVPNPKDGKTFLDTR